jgi:hypothetical protein
MDLLHDIRSDRVRYKRKYFRIREMFNTVGGILKGYGLDKSFLKRLNQAEDLPSRKNTEFFDIKTKKVFELPPFALLSREDYMLATTIIDRLANPYLPYAHCPEEMLLSVALYKANPLLKFDHLSHHHFETLLLCERAKDELVDLERQIAAFTGTVARNNAGQESRGEPSQWSSLQQRIKQLRTFIASIENTES